MNLFIVILFVNIFDQIYSIPNYKVNLQKHELAFDKPLANAELIVTENAGNPVVTFKGELLEDINDPIRAEIRFLRMEGTAFVPVFINMTIDVCDLMLQTGKHPMVSMVMKELLKDNHFPTGCPMKKGLYSLNNFSPNIGLLDMLPPVLPEGVMQQDVTFNRMVNGEPKMLMHLITSVQLGSNH